MRRAGLLTAVLGLLLFVGTVRSQEKEEKPLAGVVAFGEKLNEAMKQFVEGQPMSEAFSEFGVEEPGEADPTAEKLRTLISGADIVKTEFGTLEMELLCVAGGKGVYRLDLVLLVVGDELGAIKLKGRTLGDGEGVAVAGHDYAKPEGVYAPLGEAGKALIEAIRKRGAAAIPFSGVASIRERLDAKPVLEELDRGLARSKKVVDRISKELAGLEAVDEVRISMDDQNFYGLTAEGKIVAFIRGEFDRTDDGGFVYELDRFIPFPPGSKKKDEK